MKKTVSFVLIAVMVLAIAIITLSACSMFKSVYVKLMNGQEMIKEIQVSYGATNSYVKTSYLVNTEKQFLENNNIYIDGWYSDKSLTTPIVFDDTKITTDVTWYAKCKDGDLNRRPLTYNYRYGSGTKNDPYLIKTPEDLNAMRYGSELYHKLDNDIDLRNYNNVDSNSTIAQWKAIETYDGHFDGNNHTISGFNFHNMSGVIGFIELNIGEIKNVNFNYELSMTASKKTTLNFICDVNKGTISSCSLTGSVTLNNFKNIFPVRVNQVGGNISDIWVNMQMYVTGSSDYKNLVSFLTGDNFGTISRCSVNGVIEAKDRPASTDRYLGGLCVYNQQTGVIKECHSSVKIWGYGDTTTLGSPLVWASGITTSNYGTVLNAYFDGYICVSGGYARGAGLTVNSTGYLKYCYTSATIEQSKTISSFTVKIAPAFISGDSDSAQVARCVEVIYSNSCEMNNFSNESDNYNYSAYVKKKNLYSAETFSAWDDSIWDIYNGQLPTLKSLKSIEEK